MSDYAYTYPQDLSFLDQEFGATGRLRELAEKIWLRAGEIGADLYDLVEDWPALSDDDRLRLHLGFGAGSEEEVHAQQANDQKRYTLTRKSA
jgi:hypothetical protein